MTNSNFLRDAAIRALSRELSSGNTYQSPRASFIPTASPKPTIPLPANLRSFLPPIPQKVSSSSLSLLPFLKPTIKSIIKIANPDTVFMNGIRKEISDIVSDGINQTLARVLPTIGSLGFGEGRSIETAVLYIDIRSSSDITAFQTPKAAAKIYMAFHRSMVRAAKKYGGQIGGFAGDRIMVVFPPTGVKYQRSNAVKTAILMREVLDKVLNPILSTKFNHPLACGIGVDFGGMLVVKAGAYGDGNSDLIWSGDPANFASKLADESKEGIYISSDVYDSMDTKLKDNEKYMWLEIASRTDKKCYMYLNLSPE